jgi:segregation and condensation protein A
MESILSLYRDRPNPQNYPASYPKLWVDNKTGDIKMGESSDQGDSVDYRVELDVYNGPLDLLLYLLKRDELDIYDIPISRITETYMEYVRMLKELSSEQGLDINVAGDFLVMAATLMEIKSAMLLPKPPASQGDGSSSTAELTDPRYELVQKLLEYKKFKDAANLLDHKQVEHASRFPRYPALRKDVNGAEDDAPPVDMDEVQVWDLLDAFNRLMKEVGGQRNRFHEVLYDDTPIDLHAADIEDRLMREGKLTLRELVVGRATKSEMVGIFLALLELIREKKILVEQGEILGEVHIVSAPAEHRATYAHASLHLADDAGDGRIAAEVTEEELAADLGEAPAVATAETESV